MTGSVGDKVASYSPCNITFDAWEKQGCEFNPSIGRFTGGSMEFNGASALYLSSSSPSGLGLGYPNTGKNVTFECFVRVSRVDVTWQIIFAESGATGIFVKNNTIAYYANGATQITSPVININQWYHVALCKRNGNTTLYVDGVGQTIPLDVNLSVTCLGGFGSSYRLTGFINEFRYCNSAIYSENFTPPSAPMDLALSDYTTPIASLFTLARAYVATSSPRYLDTGAVKIVDAHHGGTFSISGTVKEAHLPSDIPLARRVRLHRKSDGLLIREVWSDGIGNYTFPNIAFQTYYVVAFDHTGTYNAVIKDSIIPVV